MNLVTKNIIANYLGKVWGFLSIFIFVRFYIDILGIESYAIINFYTVILGLLVFADAGLTAALTRELARDIENNTKSNLVYTFERLYIIICLIIIVVVLISANVVANNFLVSKIYSTHEVAYFLRLIGVGVALQLFCTLYEGGLLGLQQQVLTNKVKIIWSMFRSGVVILPMTIMPNLEIYFWWQILANLILLYFFRKKLIILLPSESRVFSKELLKSTYRYALGMMGIAFISAINIQIDKLVTSKYLTMELFGHYSIASTLAQLPAIIITPIVVAVFPMLSMLVSRGDEESIIENFHKYSFLISMIAAPVALTIAMYSVPLITIWTGKPEIASSTIYVVKILLAGSLFLCFQYTPFYLALANGFTKINLYSGIIGLLIVVPSSIYLIHQYGMLGASIPWLFINVSAFFIVGLYIVNKFLSGHVYGWLIWDILAPVAVTLFIGFTIELAFKSFGNQYFFIFKSMIIGILSIIMNIILFNKIYPHNVLINLNLLLQRKKVNNR